MFKELVHDLVDEVVVIEDVHWVIKYYIQMGKACINNLMVA